MGGGGGSYVEIKEIKKVKSYSKHTKFVMNRLLF